MDTWHVGLSPWIIQDGNYEDFHRGQVADFALEFYAPRGLTASAKQAPAAIWRKMSEYDVTAKVGRSLGKVLVLDFGIRVYSEEEGRFPESSTVAGEVHVGIDPYFYFEYLNKDPLMPPLIYRWRIDRIREWSAPFVEGTDAKGRSNLVWDETRATEREVDRTDAWSEVNGADAMARGISYVLVCTRTDPNPKRDRSPETPPGDG